MHMSISIYDGSPWFSVLSIDNFSLPASLNIRLGCQSFRIIEGFIPAGSNITVVRKK